MPPMPGHWWHEQLGVRGSPSGGTLACLCAPGIGEVEPRYVAPWPGIHEMMVTNLKDREDKRQGWVNLLEQHYWLSRGQCLPSGGIGNREGQGDRQAGGAHAMPMMREPLTPMYRRMHMRKPPAMPSHMVGDRICKVEPARERGGE